MKAQNAVGTPSPRTAFLPAWDQYNKPTRIVTLGHFYSHSQIGAAQTRLRETNAAGYAAGGAAREERQVRDGVAWTRLINALNKARRWPLERLFAQLDPMLARGIAVTVVPGHAAYHVNAPIRQLAQRLARAGRVDATVCLERHTSIRRIIFGGPSFRALHRETIAVVHPHLVTGQTVLLLDDIAKSGASLMACRDLLLEAGAASVQACALGRVVVPRDE